MKIAFFRYPIAALASNLLVVYVLFSVCRLVFLLINWSLYADTMTWGHALSLFRAGLIFDTTAILYTNVLVILMMLLPLHWKECKGYYRVVQWIYVVFNSVALWANLMDCVYFPYTGKRTTTSVFYEFSNEGVGGMSKIMGEQFLANWYLVILAFALSWVLWKAFRPKGTDVLSVKATGRYYIVNTLLLLSVIPFVVAGMRGGFSHAVRPITISNANQFVNRPAETGIVLNTPFSIYRTLSKKPLITPNYMSEQEAQSLYSPVILPTDSVDFTPKNVGD